MRVLAVEEGLEGVLVGAEGFALRVSVLGKVEGILAEAAEKGFKKKKNSSVRESRTKGDPISSIYIDFSTSELFYPRP